LRQRVIRKRQPAAWPPDQVGRGKHVRFVVETAKSRERLAAKRAKAGLA